MLTVKIRAPLMKAAAIPSDSEAPSSSSSENSLVHNRKTICSKLVLENQQAKIFPSSSLLTAIGNHPQVLRPEGRAFRPNLGSLEDRASCPADFTPSVDLPPIHSSPGLDPISEKPGREPEV